MGDGKLENSHLEVAAKSVLAPTHQDRCPQCFPGYLHTANPRCPTTVVRIRFCIATKISAITPPHRSSASLSSSPDDFDLYAMHYSYDCTMMAESSQVSNNWNAALDVSDVKRQPRCVRSCAWIFLWIRSVWLSQYTYRRYSRLMSGFQVSDRLRLRYR